MFKLKPHLSTLILVTFLIGLLTLTTMAQPDLTTDNPTTADTTVTTNNTDTVDNTLPAEGNSSSPVTTPPNEVPLGAPLINSGGGSSLIPDGEISGNSNHSAGDRSEMSRRETGFAPGIVGKEIREGMMPGIFRMRNRMGEISRGSGTGSSATNAVLNAQLQTVNAEIQQLLTSIANQPVGSDLKPQMQVLNQMLANQTALIQKINDGSTAPRANSEETNPGANWEGGE